MESAVKPILLYISQDVYKAFQKASMEDWAKQLKQKNVKAFAPATALYNKLEEADIVIYGPVVQKFDLSAKGIIPDDIYNTFEDSTFWPRLLEANEIEDIKKKCHLIEFTFKVPTRKKPSRKKRKLPVKTNGNKTSQRQGKVKK